MAVDPFAVITPDNRENINYFTTGPDFTLHFGSDTSLRFSGRYSATNYETSEFDSNQTGGSISFARQMSSSGRLSLNLEGSQVKFDNQAVNTDYDRYAAYARYEMEGKRTTMTVDAGYASLDIDGDTSDGLLARLSLSRRMSQSSTIEFMLGSQFSSAGDLFRGMQGFDGASTDPSRVTGSGDPFENHYASLNYDFARNRTGIGISVQYNEERYETDTALDRNFWSWNAYLSRDMSSRMQGRIYVRLEREDFATVDFDDQTLRVGGYLDWLLGRTLSLRLQYEHTDRNSSAAASEYTENLASLYVIWTPVRRR